MTKALVLKFSIAKFVFSFRDGFLFVIKSYVTRNSWGYMYSYCVAELSPWGRLWHIGDYRVHHSSFKSTSPGIHSVDANNLGFKWPRNCTKKSNYRSKKMFPVRHSRRRRIKREEKAKVVAVVCGMKLIHFLAAPDIFCLPGWFWRMNKIKATWWIGCIEKMDDHPVQALPIHHPTKMDVLPKTFIQIILAAKWHSSTSPQTTAMIFAFSAVFILLLSSKL